MRLACVCCNSKQIQPHLPEEIAIAGAGSSCQPISYYKHACRVRNHFHERHDAKAGGWGRLRFTFLKLDRVWFARKENTATTPSRE